MKDAASPSRRNAVERRIEEPASTGRRNLISLEKRREALRVSKDLYDHRPDWVTFFREVLGVDGAVARLFPSAEERTAFEATPEYADIQRMMAELRARGMMRVEVDDREPTRVITVRLPKSVHEALRAEAASRDVSMNKLCIAKLLNAVDRFTAEEEEPSQEQP